MHLLLRVGLLVALAARVASQRLLVIEYARSARSDYGLSAALDDEAMRSLFPVVDFLDIGAELEGMDVADVSTLLSQRIEGAAAILVKSNWYYVPDEFTRSWVLSARVPIALQVAGTELPPWLTPHVDALEEARSMGAATALLTAATLDPLIACVVADSPFSSLPALCHDLLDAHVGHGLVVDAAVCVEIDD